MARILLAAAPFTGHVAPVRAIAGALVARGDDVRVYTGPRFRHAVEASGARFLPWREAPDFDENDLSATFPRLRGEKGVRQMMINVQDVFIATAPAQHADLVSEWEREPWDVLAADEMSLGATLYAESRPTTWATIAVLPLNMIGPAGPPSGLGLPPGTNPVTRTRDALLRASVPLLARPLRAPMDRARAAVGLPPARRTFDKLVFSDRLVVAAGCPLLDYGRPDRPAHLHFAGVFAGPPTEDAPELPSWWRDLDGRTVVHVTQGTQNIDPADLIRPALEALADRDVLVVATTGVRGRDRLPFPVPANARVHGYLPYNALLPRTDVMITNGGWGGTLAALGRGIPLVIAGGDLDKPEIASRVSWAGAGVSLRTGTPSAAQVARGFDTAAGDPSYRAAARRVADQLASLGGAPRAAELIAALAPA